MTQFEVRELRKEVQSLTTAVQEIRTELPKESAKATAEHIMENFVVDGVVPMTREVVLGMMRAMETNIGHKLDQMVEKIQTAQPTQRGAQNSQQFGLPGGEVKDDGWRYWMWAENEKRGTGMHPVPKGWCLPHITSSALFNLWVTGNHSELIKPYRFIKPCDIVSLIEEEKKAATDRKVKRNYLSKANTVMATILDRMGYSAKEAEAKPVSVREQDFNKAYYAILRDKHPHYNDAQFQKRRFGDLCFVSVHGILKPGKKRKKRDAETDSQSSEPAQNEDI